MTNVIHCFDFNVLLCCITMFILHYRVFKVCHQNLKRIGLQNRTPLVSRVNDPSCCSFVTAGETVQVDEALFEGLDDLDLADLDDDEDDPDWCPDD
jgi:hypothetical protein